MSKNAKLALMNIQVFYLSDERKHLKGYHDDLVIEKTFLFVVWRKYLGKGDSISKSCTINVQRTLFWINLSFNYNYAKITWLKMSARFSKLKVFYLVINIY